jgi:iron complex outermembrane receptor protein
MDFAVPIPPNLYSTTWLNIGEMKNSGIELTLGYNVDLGKGNSWRIGFTTNHFFETELVSLSDEDRGLDFGGSQERANLGSPGQNGTNTILLEEGAPIGQIWTLRVDPDNRVAADGTWNILDMDGSGDIDAIKDRVVVGNGLPTWQLGFNNSFSFGYLDVNIFFRGTFGHDLLNTFRAFYEAPSTINTYNILASSMDIADLTDQPLLNDSHVEKANFVKLDNMTVGYTIPMKKSTGFSEIRLYLTGQNLLTFTNYTGVSPEPRLVDVGENDNQSDALAPGLDRRNTYFSARTYSIGFNLVF